MHEVSLAHQQRLTERNSRLSEDDRQAMTEEYEGLQDLVLEDPESLVRRCQAIRYSGRSDDGSQK